MSDDPRMYSKDEVEAALKIVTEVTLDRVYNSLQDLTYGIIEHREVDENGNDKMTVRQAVDWQDVVSAIDELRGDKKDDDGKDREEEED